MYICIHTYLTTSIWIFKDITLPYVAARVVVGVTRLIDVCVTWLIDVCDMTWQYLVCVIAEGANDFAVGRESIYLQVRHTAPTVQQHCHTLHHTTPHVSHFGVRTASTCNTLTQHCNNIAPHVAFCCGRSLALRTTTHCNNTATTLNHTHCNNIAPHVAFFFG